MAHALATAGHPFSPVMNAARKVVFTRTLKTAEWANTIIGLETREQRSTIYVEAVMTTSWCGSAWDTPVPPAPLGNRVVARLPAGFTHGRLRPRADRGGARQIADRRSWK